MCIKWIRIHILRVFFVIYQTRLATRIREQKQKVKTILQAVMKTRTYVNYFLFELRHSDLNVFKEFLI